MSFLFYDLYCGAGGVGVSINRLENQYEREIELIGLDSTDYSHSYPGNFVMGDCQYPPLKEGADLVWASPPCQAYSSQSAGRYGSRELAMDIHPTLPELKVREHCQRLASNYIIENVRGCYDLRDPTKIVGHPLGLPIVYERWFETSFYVPNLNTTNQDGKNVRIGRELSEREKLAKAKNMPERWSRIELRSAIPTEYVQYILSFCPDIDVPSPTIGENVKNPMEW